MKQDSPKIEREIEKTLSLLDEVEKVEINPYFYSRLKAKIEERKEHYFLKRFKFSYIIPVMLILLFIFDIFTVVIKLDSKENSQKNRSEYIDGFVKEYSILSF